MARQEFPRKIKAAAIERAKGRCEKCKAALKQGEAEVDHILEDALGGQPVLANAQVLCRPCHAAKTAERVRGMRKAERARDKSSGAIKPKSKLATKSPKPNKWADPFNLPKKRLFVEAPKP